MDALFEAVVYNLLPLAVVSFPIAFIVSKYFEPDFKDAWYISFFILVFLFIVMPEFG